jgi:hypothetical protein
MLKNIIESLKKEIAILRETKWSIVNNNHTIAFGFGQILKKN